MSRRAGGRAGAAWTAVVLAVLFCAVAGWSYGQARSDDSLAYAASRDRVLADGKAHIARLASFDAKDPGGGLRQWLDASTGPLHEELKRTKAKTGTTARASVTDAALTALDTRAGTAELIATVRVEVSAGGGRQASADRKRLEATLARTPDGWKVQALSAVPVGGS
ncbi:hypothetical protein AB0M39_32625 [Streptomyces sp. NPDC051907]|uniref:hypothetical protein n=1 Tax=Streptomyces sp. NPDC051907 TaxID=3155284 RepID=UPI0034223B70